MHPNSNGICERFNGTISNMIKHSCQEMSLGNRMILFINLYLITITLCSGTKFSPRELILTFIPHNLNDSNIPNLSENLDLNTFINIINKNLDTVDNRRLVKKNLIDSQVANKSRLDKHAIDRKLKIGDDVLFKVQPNARSKMDPRWKGPYKVVDCLSDKNYVIEINNQRRKDHIDLLQLYHNNDNVNADDVHIDADIDLTLLYLLIILLIFQFKTVQKI